MGPTIDAVTCDLTPPPRADAVVVGGMIATCAALTLSGRGTPEVLCEKGAVQQQLGARNQVRDSREACRKVVNATVGAESSRQLAGDLVTGAPLAAGCDVRAASGGRADLPCNSARFLSHGSVEYWIKRRPAVNTSRYVQLQ